MSKLDILKSTVPEILAGMQSVFKARMSGNYLRQTIEFLSLTTRIESAYPAEITQAAYIIAFIRFNRWVKGYKEKMRIESFLKEISE